MCARKKPNIATYMGHIQCLFHIQDLQDYISRQSILLFKTKRFGLKRAMKERKTRFRFILTQYSQRRFDRNLIRILENKHGVRLILNHAKVPNCSTSKWKNKRFHYPNRRYSHGYKLTLVIVILLFQILLFAQSCQQNHQSNNR